MMTSERFSTGLPRLDEMLGGGLLPGTLTVVMGATGIGKTQLGLQFAQQGLAQEGERGVIFDMSSRGDSQGHAAYARRLFDWELTEAVVDGRPLEDVWSRERARADSLHLFRRAGRRVTASDLDFDQQREWKAEINRKLLETIRFFYGNFAHGVRRCVIDGIEPADRASDSFQFDLFEYISHQILRKEDEWVARDLFRERFREQAEHIRAYRYNVGAIAALLLCTTKEVMLDDLLARPLESGDVLSNANSIILMGKTREGSRMGRALHIAKHRGSRCDDGLHAYVIDAGGLRFSDG
jgi:KaiC/GvpD/RAD55 family RecA-like ATPase